jgi:hypothetical protein
MKSNKQWKQWNNENNNNIKNNIVSACKIIKWKILINNNG